MNAMREVLSLELTQRARSTRWRVLLVAWFVVLVGTVVLQTLFFDSVGPGVMGDESTWTRSSAEAIATGTLLFVLLVGLLVAPAQTATSINGDRRDGVLALVQAAPVSTWAVAVGKLLAAWLASLAFLLVSLPVLVWTVIRGGLTWWALLLGVAVVALLLLAVSGMGLGLSALTPRTASSTMLSYLIVAVLTVGLPLVFALSMPLTEHRETRQVAHLAGAESEAFVAGVAAGIAIGKCGYQHGSRMGRHVPAVGNQRHRAEDAARGDFDHHHRGGDGDDQPGPALVSLVIVAQVDMLVRAGQPRCLDVHLR